MTTFCSNNMAICGIKVRMGDYKTAMNGAKFQCCELPSYDVSTYLPPVSSKSYLTTLEPTSTAYATLIDTRSKITGNINLFLVS